MVAQPRVAHRVARPARSSCGLDMAGQFAQAVFIAVALDHRKPGARLELEKPHGFLGVSLLRPRLDGVFEITFPLREFHHQVEIGAAHLAGLADREGLVRLDVDVEFFLDPGAVFGGQIRRLLQRLRRKYRRLGDHPVPVVAVSDWIRAVPDQIARWVPGPFTSLGTDGWGFSDTRSAARRFFGVDAESITLAVLGQLVQRGELKQEVLAEAIAKYRLDLDVSDALS